MPKVSVDVRAYTYLWDIAVNACKLIDTDDPVGLLDERFGAYLPSPRTDICQHCGYETMDLCEKVTCPRCDKQWDDEL